MEEKSVLQMVIIEEYDRLKRLIDGIEKELLDLPKGYISAKMINNKECFYLQWRDGNKVKSKYIQPSNFLNIKEKVNRRQDLEKSLRIHKKDLKRLEKFLGQTLIKENQG